MINSGLYVEWTLADEADSLRPLLATGERNSLYKVRSWMAARGRARALLVPVAPLEEIAKSLWAPVAAPLTTRWVTGQGACAALTKEIERAPVRLGLANSPEEWPHSSAFQG